MNNGIFIDVSIFLKADKLQNVSHVKRNQDENVQPKFCTCFENTNLTHPLLGFKAFSQNPATNSESVSLEFYEVCCLF